MTGSSGAPDSDDQGSIALVETECDNSKWSPKYGA